MLQYSNYFVGAYSDSSNSFVLRLNQVAPTDKLDQDGSPITETEDVVSIVIDGVTSKKISQFIDDNVK